MIVGERKPVVAELFKTGIREKHLEEFAENGLLTEDGSKFPKYKIREAALLRLKLGRPLTDEEMKQFEIKS